jgi:hypothetical protein
MVRISATPVPYIEDSVPPPAAPLAPDTRGEVRVRLHDPRTGQFLRAEHELIQPLRPGYYATAYGYTTGTEPQGWGKTFWLKPGPYIIEVTTIPCGHLELWLARSLRREFTASPGDTTSITFEVDVEATAVRPSHDNPEGLPCSKLLRR